MKTFTTIILSAVALLATGWAIGQFAARHHEVASYPGGEYTEPEWTVTANPMASLASDTNHLHVMIRLQTAIPEEVLNNPIFPTNQPPDPREWEDFATPTNRFQIKQQDQRLADYSFRLLSAFTNMTFPDQP